MRGGVNTYLNIWGVMDDQSDLHLDLAECLLVEDRIILERWVL